MRFSDAIRRQLQSDQSKYDTVLRIPIGLGDASTERTIAAMRAIVRDAADSPEVHQFASTIAALAPNRDRRAQLEALDQVFREVLHFKPDVADREVLRQPEQIIHEITTNGRASCDCDDVAMLGAAVIRGLGMQPALITVGASPESPYEHVHFAALLRKPRPQLFGLDPQERITPGRMTPAGKRAGWWA